MVKVSIACLIYRSINYLKFVKKSIEEHTPMLKTGDAEFFFVCNNATDEVKKYLKDNNITHVIFETGPEPQPKYPKNIGYIYQAWNTGVMKAKGDVVVLVNSDMAFSRNWLENMLNKLDMSKVITSRLVESGKIPSIFPHTIVNNFGRKPDEFRKEDFEMFAESVKINMICDGGTFMPIAIAKDNFIKAGGYPEGNRILEDGRQISGDQIFFYERLGKLGIKHYTSMDSLVYHIQEGEVSE